MTDAWIITRSSLPGAAPATSCTAASPDLPITIGRRAEVSLGVDVPDEGISRVALAITATTDGWVITNTSRNGVIVNPWGLAPQRPTATLRLRWSLIAVRVFGTRSDARHVVLLECDEYDVAHSVPIIVPGPTAGATPPRPLRSAEIAALEVVFEPALAWPLLDSPAEPLQLKQAGRRLGITASAVKVRLEGARAKAELLGLERQAGVTDPAYLHVLVASGYLRPPTQRCHPTRIGDRTDPSPPPD
jgi:hypothetical protein